MARRHGDDESLDAELEAEEQEEGAWLRACLQKTPWWLLSLVLHGLVLGCLGLITFSKAVIFDDAPIKITLVSRESAKLPDLVDTKRTMFETPASIAPDPTSEVPPVFDPLAELGPTNETPEEKETHTRRGEDPSSIGAVPGLTGGIGRQPGAAKAVTDVMGTGEGGGGGDSNGLFDGGGRRRLRTGHRGPPRCEAVVDAGLRWLARHQRADGGWSAEGFDGQCAEGRRCGGPGVGQFDVGVSGLSLLSFLGAGYTHLTRMRYVDPHTRREVAFGQVVRRGCEHLLEQQDAQGCFGPRTGEYLYNHAIATLALVEAYGMTSASMYREPAQRAVDFLVAAQNPALGWRYTPMCGDNDTSVTGWSIMALKSALLAKLDVPHHTFEGARSWLDRVTDASGQVGYMSAGQSDVFVPGKNEQWRSHPSMTAIGLLLRIYIDTDARDPVLGKSARIVAQDLPRWDPARHEIDCYAWYYAALALYQYKDCPGGESLWLKWNDAMQAALIPSQHTLKDGCLDGSWDPELDRWGYAGGRVYLTAVNTMTLEVYYRYASLFGRGPPRPR